MSSRRSFEKLLADRAKQGAVFEASYEGRKFWYVGGHEYLRVLTRPRKCPFRIINTELVNRLFRSPLFNLEGEEHQKRRGLWKSALQDSNLMLLSKLIESESSRELSRWRKRIRLKEEMQCLMNCICASTILGIRSRLGHSLFAWLYGVFQGTLLICERDSLQGRVSVLRGMLAARCLRALMSWQGLKLRLFPQHEGSLLGLVEKNRHSFRRAAINDDLLAILVAARDTTSSALTWMMLELAAKPSLQLSLRSECEAQSVGGPLDFQRIRALQRCQSFVFEVLRVHSPNLFAMKEAKEDVVLGGCAIAVGDCCAYSPVLEHFNPEIFPFPMEFDPERFLCLAKSRSLLTFGVGSHSCIGKYVAQIILTTILCKVVTTFDLETPTDGWSDYVYSSLGKFPKEDVFVCLQPR